MDLQTNVFFEHIMLSQFEPETRPLSGTSRAARPRSFPRTIYLNLVKTQFNMNFTYMARSLRHWPDTYDSVFLNILVDFMDLVKQLSSVLAVSIENSRQR